MRILHIAPIKIPTTAGLGEGGFESSGLEPIPGLGSDGPSRSVLGLARALAGEKVGVGVLNTLPFEPRLNGSLPGVRFLPPYRGHKYSPFIPADDWLDRIEREFGRPDLVDFHDIYNFFCASLGGAMRRRGWRYIVSCRGGLSRFAQRRRFYKKVLANLLFARRFLRGASFIHALNEREADEIRRFDPSLTTRISPNGLPEEIVSQPVRVSQEGPLLFGFLGLILWEIKGIDLLLEAIRQFQYKRPDLDARFDLAGPIRFESEKKKIERAMARIPHPERVRLVGPRYEKEKSDFLHQIDIFVQPSRTEGMSVVSLEAMAHGRPCLFSQGTNMAELIDGIEGGWGYDGSAEALCQRLIEAAGTPRERLARYGQNARDYFEKNFTWDRVVKKYLEMIE